MNFNAFLKDTKKIDETVICGKILLNTKEWEISFTCDFCCNQLATLPELLRHVLSVHVDDVPQDKLQELCGIEVEKFDEFESENFQLHSVLIEAVDGQENQPQAEHEIEKNAKGKFYEDADETSPIDEEDDDEENEMKSRGDFDFVDVTKKKKPKQKQHAGSPIRDYKGPRKLKCNECSARFRYLYELADHQKEHGMKPHICGKCGAAFRDKTNLKVHYNRHLGIKPYVCKLCMKGFTTSTELKSHGASHTGERAHKCPICDKAFIHLSTMISHRRTHSDERPHLCPICGKTFRDNDILKGHMVTHSTERPHKCTECEASFKIRDALRQHMNLHSDVKKYSCQYCGKSFAQAAGVYSHIKMVHKKEREANTIQDADSDGNI